VSRAIRNRLAKLEQAPIWATGFEHLTDADLNVALANALETLFDDATELSQAMADEDDGPAVRGAVEWLAAVGHEKAVGWAKALG